MDVNVAKIEYQFIKKPVLSLSLVYYFLLQKEVNFLWVFAN